MEKSKIKNLKLRLKAGVLTAVALIPGVSCGRNVGKQEPGANVSIETEANTNSNTNNIITTTTTKGNKTTTNTFVTGTTNNNNNGYVDYNNGYVDNNNNGYVDNNNGYVDNNNTNSTEAKTENKTNPTTHQNPTQNTNKTTTTKIKNSDIKVTTTKANNQNPTTTKKVTTTKKTTTVTTTKKPVVTTTTVKVTQPPVTQPPRTDYNKYDLLDSDPAVAAKAFEKLADELWNELYAGVGIDRGYLSNGKAESKVAIAILNYNSISPEVLASNEALGNYSEEDIITYAHALDFEVVEQMVGTRVDFSKYMLDQDFADFINRTNSAWIDYENGNEDEYLDIIWNSNYEDNLIKNYYIKLASASTYDANGIDREHLYNAMDEYDENIVRPMYNNYAPYIGNSFRR